MDIADATDDELNRLKKIIDGEIARRKTIASAESRLDELTRDVLAARGV